MFVHETAPLTCRRMLAGAFPQFANFATGTRLRFSCMEVMEIAIRCHIRRIVFEDTGTARPACRAQALGRLPITQAFRPLRTLGAHGRRSHSTSPCTIPPDRTPHPRRPNVFGPSAGGFEDDAVEDVGDRKSTRLNSSHWW